MTFLSILSIIAWTATIGSIVGQVFIIFKKTIGFGIWSVAAVLQIIVAFSTGNMSQLVLWIFFLIMDIISWVKWIHDDRKGNK